MKKFIIAGCAVTLLAGAAVSQMQDDAPQPQMPEMPQPQEEHKWLQQLTGAWVSEVKMPGAPEQPGFETKGTETVRAIGACWIVAENHGDMMGTPFTGILTLGFDARKDKYVGTWIDSVTDYMWVYEGAVNEAGDTLTLTTEGPNPQDPDATLHFKESIQIKDKDHKVFTSSVRGEDGSWNQVMTINYTRKK